MRRHVAIGMAVAQRPAVGGHTWLALQWLLGFRSLGWDPMLVDWVTPAMCRDGSGRPCPPEDWIGVKYLADVMHSFGLGDAWTVLVPGGEPLGVQRRELKQRMQACEIFVNVMGYVQDELLPSVPPRVFLDIDPGFGQMWKALGLHDVFAGHDRCVSVGMNLGRDGCLVPGLGIEWIPTLPPVELGCWPAVPRGEHLTSVATWRGPFGPIAYRGRVYGLRVHEFRRFFELPRRTRTTFRMALEIDPADRADLARLAEHGWGLVDPRSVAADPVAYREFIQGSAAELNVAKGLYVETRGGWFSDRSACYLASGKPVIAQDTGFAETLPAGAGLLAFTTLDEAAAAIEDVLGDYRRHARAAREMAEEHFAADRVIRRLLTRLGMG